MNFVQNRWVHHVPFMRLFVRSFLSSRSFEPAVLCTCVGLDRILPGSKVKVVRQGQRSMTVCVCATAMSSEY